MHEKPRPRMPGVRERLSQYKFDAIKIKSLDEIKQTEQTSTTGRIVTQQSPVSAVNGQVLPKGQRSSKCQSAVVRKNKIDGVETTNSDSVDKPSFKVKDVLRKASLQMQGTTNSQTNVKNPPGNMKLADPSSQLFSSEHKQSSESIFSPKFNPTLSQPSSAQSDKSVSMTSPTYKFNFDDRVCEVSKENVSTVTDVQGKAISNGSPSISVSKQSTSSHEPKVKPVQLKRPATSDLKDMPEIKKVN